MKKRNILVAFIFMILLSGYLISSQETNITLSPYNSSVDSSLEYPSSNYSSNRLDENNESVKVTTSVSIVNIIPKEFKLGDTQINIRVKNNDRNKKTDLVALVSAKGFSTYEVVPIESLEPASQDYIIVYGNFRIAGNITLTIRIDNNVFKASVIVIDSDLIEKQIEEETNKQLLANLTIELSYLKQNYSKLETEYYNKEDNNYDVSKVSLDELKAYVRSVESDLLNEDAKSARANLQLGLSEYNDQKSKLNSAQKISLLTRLKENAVLFSAIAGAIITFFALSELLRRKGESIFGKIEAKKEKKKRKIRKIRK